jgi:phage tail-like protein
MADEKLDTIKYWKIQAENIQDLSNFSQCSLPSIQVTATPYYVWDNQAKPVPKPVGVHATFSDVALTRGVDKEGTLYQAVSKVAQKGASQEAGTVSDITVIGCDENGDPVQTWVLKDAFLSSYQAAGLAAGGTDVLTESVTIHYMEAQLDGKGGLTGDVG